MTGAVDVDVVLFDVNETLSDMAPMAARFADVGVPAGLAPLWFAAVLRDGFALTAAGRPGRFGEIGAGVLRGMLAAHRVAGDPDAAVAHVMGGFMALPVHPDVPAGVAALAGRGLRLVTLSNGAAEVAERLLAAAGLRERFAACLSVDDAAAWKPDPRAYAYAARTCGVEPARMLMVAVHPWDIDGAAGAGLRTAWISRDGGPYPAHFRAPDVTAPGLEDLAAGIGPGRRRSSP